MIISSVQVLFQKSIQFQLTDESLLWRMCMKNVWTGWSKKRRVGTITKLVRKLPSCCQWKVSTGLQKIAKGSGRKMLTRVKNETPGALYIYTFFWSAATDLGQSGSVIELLFRQRGHSDFFWQCPSIIFFRQGGPSSQHNFFHLNMLSSPLRRGLYWLPSNIFQHQRMKKK